MVLHTTRYLRHARTLPKGGVYNSGRKIRGLFAGHPHGFAHSDGERVGMSLRQGRPFSRTGKSTF